MPKNIIGFNSEDDFDRMSRSVRKSENTPQTGQRQRRLYPVNAGGGGGLEVRFEVVSVDSGVTPKTAVVEVLSTDVGVDTVPEEDGSNQITVYDKAGCYITSPYASLVGQEGYARYMHDKNDTTNQWEVIQLCQP